MNHKNTIATIVTAAALCLTSALTAQAFEDSQYPNLKGMWTRVVGPNEKDGVIPFDPSRPPGRGQQAPLTPEYQKIFEANLKEQELGVPGSWPGPSCLPPGLPAQMTAYNPMEIVVLPSITYIRVDYIRETRRRIYTDGRPWPQVGTRPGEAEEGFDGYSIGKWVDEDKDGKFDVLEVETRYFKGPRFFDLTGIPLHEDNETVIKERIYLDKADQNLLHNDITVEDHALTRPWTVKKSYRRAAETHPQWPEHICVWEVKTLRIGDELYRIGNDGLLAPTKKDQEPPSLKYFPNAQ
jgi:hypothetical protein